MNNENKKFSRNGKKRIQRSVKIDDKLKSLSKKIEKKNENFDKIQELELNELK